MRGPLIVLLAADAISMTGNAFTMLAVPWFVLQTTGSAARTGAAAFVSTVPIVISATFAGALVDRAGLRRASVACDLASGLIVAAIPALLLSTGLPYGLLLVLLFTRWLLATPGDTARAAMLPDLAGRGHVPLERATAAQDGTYRGARMAGAPLAGVLIVWLGPANLLFVDAATFLASAVLIRYGAPRTVPHRDLRSSRRPGGLREGLAFLWGDRLQRSAVAMVLVTNMLDTGLSQVLLPGYARAVAHDPRAFGLVIGAVGAGAVAGTITYGTIGRRLPRRVTFAVCFLVAGAPRPLVLASHAHLGVVLAVTAVSGFAAGAINPLLGTLRYERIPARLRARVLGAITAGTYAGMPVGGLAAGALAEVTGLTPTLLGFSAIYLLASAPPLTDRVWREFDVRPRADADLVGTP